MLTETVPTYVIDLAAREPKRWAEVISRQRDAARHLVAEAAVEFQGVPEALRWGFGFLYRSWGGLYRREIQAWAEGLGVSVGTTTLLNCAYELSHARWPGLFGCAAGLRWVAKVFGCTAGIRWVDGLGPVHARSLDWPLPSIAGATCLFRMRRGPREFVVVGMAGHVGALSGMLPHAYSVTINWAPPTSLPTFDFGPAFLLRHTLETCDSYEAAVTSLKSTRLSTSAFYTICGTERGQACVIERTQREAVVREMTGAVLVQANHHLASRFQGNNQQLREVEEGEQESFFNDSARRLEALERVLEETRAGCRLDEVGGCLNVAPVLNDYTCQRMAFCPRTGEAKVWKEEGPTRQRGDLPG
jgi:hypothetical protein